MTPILLWFAILSSGGVLGAAFWKHRFEEILPITCSVIVLVMFFCGVAGNLSVGAVLVNVLGVVAYIAAVFEIIRRRNWKDFVYNFFTPGFLGFVIVFVLTCLLNFGRVAYGWDEFSHWADIVKVMATLDDFGTNSEAHSMFQSYPPGMSLFQYFPQKLFQWTTHMVFSEWQMYAAYQVFVFAFMLPFLKALDRKRFFALFVLLIIMFFCPMLFFSNIYQAIYIDPFLGVLSGTGLAAVFLCRKRDMFYSLRVLFTISMLVLAKDAGLLLAGFLALAYVLDYIHGYRTDNGKAAGKFLYKQWICIPVALLAIVIPKFMWSFHLKVTEAWISFSAPYDFRRLARIIFGLEAGWQRTLFVQYFRKLIDLKVPFGNTNISLNYYVLLLFLMGILAILCLLFEKKNYIYQWKGRMLLACMGAQFAVYIVGLCLTYIFKFTEYEARRFASLDRYLNIIFLAAWMMITMIFLEIIQQKSQSSLALLITAAAVFATTVPLGDVFDFLCGAYVTDSLEAKALYQKTIEDINRITETSCIYFICQESTGYEILLIKYNCRPHSFNSNGWSIGEAFYDGDVWTIGITAEEWQEDLMTSYDYVFLYRINDYFVNNYAQLFDTEELDNGSLYKINKEKGLLEKYGE